MNELMTMNDVCGVLGVKRTTIYRMIEDGRLPKPFKLSPGARGHVRFKAEAIQEAVAAMQAGDA